MANHCLINKDTDGDFEKCLLVKSTMKRDYGDLATTKDIFSMK